MIGFNCLSIHMCCLSHVFPQFSYFHVFLPFELIDTSWILATSKKVDRIHLLIWAIFLEANVVPFFTVWFILNVSYMFLKVSCLILVLNQVHTTSISKNNFIPESNLWWALWIFHFIARPFSMFEFLWATGCINFNFDFCLWKLRDRQRFQKKNHWKSLRNEIMKINRSWGKLPRFSARIAPEIHCFTAAHFRVWFITNDWLVQNEFWFFPILDKI